MKQNRKYPEGLLVSKKFYSDIITRLDSIGSLSNTDHENAVKYVTCYLCGRPCEYEPAGVALIIVDLLRPELDRAVERSRRARQLGEKRRKRKEQGDSDNCLKAESFFSQKSMQVDGLPDVSDEEADKILPPMNRHQRRLLERLLKKKNRRDSKNR